MAEYFVKNIIIRINTQPNLCKNLEIWLSIAIFAENILNVLAMIIGRENEQRQLLDLYKSDYSEFVAIYGRRRVGKTFLVRETFNYRFTFQHTGIQGGHLLEISQKTLRLRHRRLVDGFYRPRLFLSHRRGLRVPHRFWIVSQNA